MFKTAARKIAHNSVVPGLAGKTDLRTLQDLITAEKAVMNSLQKLSTDFARASDALRVWGQGEGDDLGDTLTASNALLLHFASAIASMSHHEVTIREEMKAVRTREENLDALKRRRKSVISDADAAERKLSKMNPENKNLQQQTDVLNRLRDEIRAMDAEIAAEEANLGDFKRSSVRSWMGRKFGGLSECCEKGAVVGELGKLVICEIPMEQTQPGMPRPYYSGYARTEFLVAEAARAVSEIMYSPEPDPSATQRSIRRLPGVELPPVPSPSQQRRMSVASGSGSAFGQAPGTPIQQGYGTASPALGGYPGLPQVDESGFSVSPFMSSEPPRPLLPLDTDEFGSFSSPPSQQPSSFSAAEKDKVASPRGGRFATFPIKALGPRPPPASTPGSAISTNPYISSPPMRDGDRVPSIEIDRNNDESFSSSVAQALGHYSMDGSAAGPSAGTSRFAPPRSSLQDTKNGDFAPQRYSPPPPMYSPSDGQGLPAGAAPSQAPTAMRDGPAAVGLGIETDAPRPASTYEVEEEGLAYMSPSRLNGSTESLPDTGDRRVRFGGVSDADEELQHRHEEEERAAVPPAVPAAPTVSTGPTRVPVPRLEEEYQVQSNVQNGRLSPEVRRSQPSSPTHSDSVPRGRSPSGSPTQMRVPTPPAPSPEVGIDERSLNAIAAREVSRELDALMMSSSPPQSPVSPVLSQPQPAPFSTRPLAGTNPYVARSVSPLVPPSITTSSQPTSPKLEGMYVRERDRSLGSPAIRAPASDLIPPAPASPTASDVSDAQQQRPSLSTTRSPSFDTNGASYRTPIGTPSAAPSHSMYNLPTTTGSNTSFQAAAGARTISAAAFRRQQAAQRNMSSEGLADTTPLNVKKRPLPASPYPSQSLLPGQAQGMRSVSAPQVALGPGNVEDRPVSHYNQEDDYDYISAYAEPERASGYGSGRFATHTEDPNGIR